MIILHQGKLPPKDPIYYRGTCLHCKCTVQCREDDPLMKDNLSVMCPTKGCFRVIYLAEERPEHKPEALKNLTQNWWDKDTPLEDAFENLFPSEPSKRKLPPDEFFMTPKKDAFEDVFPSDANL